MFLFANMFELLIILGLLVALLLCYTFYAIYLAALRERMHFRAFSNVWVNPAPGFLTNDMKDILARQQRNPKYIGMQYPGDVSVENPEKDFVLV